MKLITHDGTFHGDDVLAYVVLRTVFDLGDESLLRTRDEGEMAGAGDSVIFDVGRRYDPGRRMFDHHMRDRPLRDDGTPYSSFGLVWLHYGKAFIMRLMDRAAAPLWRPWPIHPGASENEGIDEQVVHQVWTEVDLRLVLPIDRADNGIGETAPDSIASIIDTFNPNWDDSPRDEDTRFLDASRLAMKIVLGCVATARSTALAREEVVRLAREAEDPRIIVLPQSMPWVRAMSDASFDRALYVLHPAKGDQWMCVAVPPEPGSFDQRLPLPADWAGLDEAGVAATSGVPDATFCHPNRFCCGARSLDGALAMAREAIRIGTRSSPVTAP